MESLRPIYSVERRRLERDLHDGVQNELVSLLLKLRLAEEDPSTPQTLAETFATLADHATAALHSLREITHGIYPRRLERFGVRSALLARAERAAVEVTVEGSAPRSTQKAEEAIYFACSEAIQNSAKHAGRGASVTLRMQHRDDWLAVRIADDGDGFDPLRTPSGAGLENIRDRADDLDGSFTVTSRRGYGTELMIALPWPPRAGRQR